MIIYADVLFILNTVTDYFLIKLSGVITRQSAVFWRLAAAAVLGGLSSFYILLPPLSFYIDIPVKAALCSLLILTAYGFKSLKRFIKLTSVLFAMTFLLGGIISAIVFYFEPENIYSNNQIPYIDINPVIFVLSGAGYYLVAVTIRHFTQRHGEFSKECRITIYVKNISYHLVGMVDTGNSLTDVFGMSEIIITENSILKKIKNILSREEISKRLRIVPVKTVSGEDILNGIRVDKAVISLDKTEKTLVNPIIVSSKTAISDGWDAIINPRSIV